ncbi:MAG: YHYH protein, partial [Flavobacteriales bacterium]|nr:YHYH protein [Flavobacteriales bacterium]
MKKIILPSFLMFTISLFGQTNPAITNWLINTTGLTGRHYVNGNPTPIVDAVSANVQTVQYSASWVYVSTKGIPSYITGPFLDGNPSLATSQNAIFKISLNPVQNTGHPAMGNYHHHQNPSAFNLDLTVISNICDIYAADGLYAIDATQHSPLIGYSYDGFPIYGAYGYANTDGTGGITRIKSSYQLRNISTRTTYSTGATVTAGPAVSTTYPLGYFREDYEYISQAGQDYLDEHNGRFCKTPEYPNGIYCYFATVDANWNSAYPYVVGPTFYGTKTGAKVTSITETVTTYTSTSELSENTAVELKVFPNPTNDVLMVQLSNLIKENVTIKLVDLTGKV